MNPIEDERELLRRSIAALEGQRSILGDAVVDTALGSLREKLAALQPNPNAEQRKLVTVLFADLVGFTAMSAHRDAEEVRDIMHAYFTRWTSCIEKAGGVVEKFIGDAVMAIFGLAVTHEDDPQNAVSAALEMRQSLIELNQQHERAWGQQLAMRVGIHTGMVMVSFLGERKGQDFVAVGDTINLASRLQSAAPAGAIYISQDTFRHVRGLFDLQMIEPFNVKGKDELIQAYLVLRAKNRSFRTQTRGVEGIETAMVGRESELARLQEALKRAIERNKTEVCIVSGEGGIGKSRLVVEFDNWVELLPQVVRYFKGRASPVMQNLPNSLLRDLFAFRFQIYDSDPPQVVQEKIERGIGEPAKSEATEGLAGTFDVNRSNAVQEPAESLMRAHYIGQMLGFRIENSPYISSGIQNPRNFRDRAMSYLVDYFKQLSSLQPVVVLLEDIHWADDSSLEILEQLFERLPDEPLLAIGTARPVFFDRHPEWLKNRAKSEAAYQLIQLSPLTLQDSQHLVGDILQKIKEIPVELRELVVSRAEGNPFFMEEVIKMLIEEGVVIKDDDFWRVDLSRLENVLIPTTLVEVLQSRLESLSLEERVLLQRAAVLGRTFWDAIIGFIEQSQEDMVQINPQLVKILTDLSGKEMIYPQKVSAFENTREFQFKHTLLRDVTYESTLKRLRKVYHACTAEWLEAITQVSRRSDEYAVMIAEHFEKAEDWKNASSWYRRAGILAADIYANTEAVRCFTRYLELTAQKDSADYYDVMLRRVKVYDTLANRPAQKSDLEALQSLAEALDAQDRVENRPGAARLAQVHLQWWFYYEATGDLQASISAARLAVEIAVEAGAREFETVGNLYLGAAYWKQANYSEARQYLERSLTLAREIKSRQLESDSLRNLGIVLQYQRDFQSARIHYENARRIYQEDGNERGESMVINSLGSLMIDQEAYREARPYFLRSLELKRKIGHRRAENITLFNLALLADVLGDYSEAVQYLEKALRFDQETGDREGEGETLLGLGKTAFHLGDHETARVRFSEALPILREYDNKSSECSTLVAMAYLAHRTGDNQRACELSQEAYQLALAIDLPSEQINCLCIAGHALFELEQYSEAKGSYQKGLELALQSGKASQIGEIRAGLARVYLRQKQVDQALAVVAEIIARLTGKNQAREDDLVWLDRSAFDGMEEPFRVLLTCEQVLGAANDPRASRFAAAARRLLMEQADRLEDAGLRRSFLENIPVHREIGTLAGQYD